MGDHPPGVGRHFHGLGVRSPGARTCTPKSPLAPLPTGHLSIENDQLILRKGQFSDADRISPKRVRRNLRWVVAGAQDDDFGARKLFQQLLKIAVGRDQNESMLDDVLENPSVTGSARAFRRALSGSENTSVNSGANRGDKLSSKRSFILRRLWRPARVRRRTRTRQGSHPARAVGSR